ncbi:c-type cytochrome [Uliginosibacterium gangwonense]|uniref:c-type cytochrome n=1 Tax=Uliginosibacterium gangwonense TaxID=392736 RepID=UPI0003760496|nr:c-type cytochrome [Uliginosibacterium gangwonense]
MPPRFTALLIAGAALACLPAHAVGNAAHGAKVFQDQCSDCHTTITGKNKRGPSLAGVVGRSSASVPYYNYSDAARAAKLQWTPERLTRYLASPKTDLPGTKMRLLSPPSAADVADVIAYLQTVR